jgi:VanZ family protein
MLLIFILSSMPVSSLHLPDFWDLFSLDKAAHAVFYFTLFFMWKFSLKKAGWILHAKHLILIMTGCIVYGGMIELYQGNCLDNRTADWVDEVANTIGAVSAFIYNHRR